MKTYNDVGVTQLTGLCGALGLGANLQGYVALQQFLFEPWGDELIPERPEYASHVGDDHSPYEYSIALSPEGAELRVMCEAQAKPASLLANYRAGLELNQRLAARFGLDLSRFEGIRALFTPSNNQPIFALWHAASLKPRQPPDFKIYLNPQLHGRERASQVVADAMQRLGFGGRTLEFLQHAARRGAGADESMYFSLDLANDSKARVKVYFRHHGATAKDIEESFAEVPCHRSGDARDFCRSIAIHEGPFTKKPMITCFAFTEESDLPVTATLHHPIAHYVEDDATTMSRVGRYLAMHGIDADAYVRAVSVIAREPLENCRGVQSYASYRRERAGMRVTAYLSPELYRKRMTSFSSSPRPYASAS